MGFDGFLVPDWAKPIIGYAVGMDWPEGDEDGCFRLADACAETARAVMSERGIATFHLPGDDWDGEALRAYVTRVQSESDPALTQLVEQLVSAALHYNDLGVQVQYTKRMIEVSVWFLIFQIIWLTAAAAGPMGPAAAAMIGTRVQLTRVAIAQLAKRLLINIGLFGGLMGGMDLAVQASQSRRDHLDWGQIMTSAGTGALLGGFLTAFTGIVPARSMLGLMGRSGAASGATDLTMQLTSGEPLDWDRLVKSVTSGVLGGADAHWASWSPSYGKSSAGPVDSVPVNSPSPTSFSSLTPSPSHTPFSANSASPPHVSFSTSSHSPAQAVNGPGGLPPEFLLQDSAGRPQDPSGRANADHTELAGAAVKQDATAKSGLSIDSLINGPRTTDPPGPTGDGAVLAGAKPPGLDPASLARQAPGPFRILDNPGRSGDGYLSGGLWGKYGAAGVLIRGLDGQGQPRYLLMQQSQFVSNPGKWQLPGGALDSLERPVHGAARELSEELGVNQGYLRTLKLKGEHPVEVGDSGWTYTNLAAEGPMFTPKLDSFETSAAKWVTLQQLSSMANNGQLHPALAEALPDLLALYHQEPAAPPQDHYTASGATHHIKPPVDFGAHSVPGDPAPWQASHGKPPAYSGLVADGPSPGLSQTIHRTESGLYYTAAAPHVPLDAPYGARFVSPAFGDAVWRGVYDDMTLAEREAAQRYSDSGYKQINGFLREGDSAIESSKARDFEQDRARVIDQIESLSAVLNRQPVPETIDVFRAVTNRPGLFTVPIEELPGTVQRDPAFFSTSIGDRPAFVGEIHLHLRVPEGTPAFFLKLISEHRHEEELLLGTGVTWFAEDVRRQDGRWHVYGWVLPQESDG